MGGHVLKREEGRAARGRGPIAMLTRLVIWAYVSDPRRQGRLWTEGAVGLRLSRFGEGGPGPRTGAGGRSRHDRIRVNSGQSISITTQPHVSVNSSPFSRQRNEMLVGHQPVAQPISPSFLKVTQQCRCKSGAPLIGRHGGDTEVKANKA